jgi:hypothetical protein
MSFTKKVKTVICKILIIIFLVMKDFHCLPLEPIQSGENPFISANFTSTNCLSSFEGHLNTPLVWQGVMNFTQAFCSFTSSTTIPGYQSSWYAIATYSFVIKLLITGSSTFKLSNSAHHFGALDSSQTRRPSASMHHHSSIQLLKHNRKQMMSWLEDMASTD